MPCIQPRLHARQFMHGWCGTQARHEAMGLNTDPAAGAGAGGEPWASGPSLSHKAGAAAIGAPPPLDAELAGRVKATESKVESYRDSLAAAWAARK